MVTYEAHLDAEIRVLLVPQGQDPDDVIRHSPDLWARLVEEAVPVVEYAIAVATEGRNLDDPKVKKQIVRDVSPLIDDIADSTERTHFRQRLARLLKIDERALMISSAATALPARVRPRRAADDAHQEAIPEPDPFDTWFDPQTAALPRETRCLAALIRLPNLVYKADRMMKRVAHWPTQGDWTGLAPQDFANAEYQMIFEAWRSSLTQPDNDPFENLRGVLDDVLLARLDAVLDEHSSMFGEADQQRVSDETLSLVLEMRVRRLGSDLQGLKFLAQDAHEEGDLTASQYHETINGYVKAKYILQQMMAEYSATGEWTVAGLQM
jgi:DNA primase